MVVGVKFSRSRRFQNLAHIPRPVNQPLEMGHESQEPHETVRSQQGNTVTGVTTPLCPGQLPLYTCDPSITNSKASRSQSSPIW